MSFVYLRMVVIVSVLDVDCFIFWLSSDIFLSCCCFSFVIFCFCFVILVFKVSIICDIEKIGQNPHQPNMQKHSKI